MTRLENVNQGEKGIIEQIDLRIRTLNEISELLNKKPNKSNKE